MQAKVTNANISDAERLASALGGALLAAYACPKGVKVLGAHPRLLNDCYRCLVETAQWSLFV